jgi:hypothetical protein
MRMKTKTNSVLAVYRSLLTVCILIMPLLSCSFFGIPDYALTVTFKDGVAGTPDSGQHSYKDLTVVDYSYTPVNALHTVEVIYQTSQLAASGTITMYNNTAIEVRPIDIRTTWDISSYNSSTATTETFTITFSGTDILSGTFSDSRGYSGTWNAASNVINIIYSNWEAYKWTGTLFSMSGTWSNGSITGTWSATRQ